MNGIFKTQHIIAWARVDSGTRMSALGQQRTLYLLEPMSAIWEKADIADMSLDQRH